MIPVPMTSLPSNPQPGTSAQSVFSTADPPLPVPPQFLQHAQDLLKRHEASKSHTEEQAIAQPSGSAASRKEEEEEMEVIDDDDEDYVQPDDGHDNDDDDEGDDDDGQEKGKKYIMKQHGKPVPPHLQNPKRSYCECGKSYLHGSDLKRHKLEECGKTGRK